MAAADDDFDSLDDLDLDDDFADAGEGDDWGELDDMGFDDEAAEDDGLGDDLDDGLGEDLDDGLGDDDDGSHGLDDFDDGLEDDLEDEVEQDDAGAEMTEDEDEPGLDEDDDLSLQGEESESLEEEAFESEEAESSGRPWLMWLISAGAGMMCAALAVTAMFFLQPQDSQDMQELQEHTTQTEMETDLELKPDPTKSQAMNLKPILPEQATMEVEPPTKTHYTVRFGECLQRECLSQYRRLLGSLGQQVSVVRYSKRVPMWEVVTRATFDAHQASRLADSINKRNPLSGNAHRQQVAGGYRISMGTFPSQGTAEHVLHRMNQLYRAEVVFHTRKTSYPVRYMGVQVGNFTGRQEAYRLRDRLQRKHDLLKNNHVVSFEVSL